MFEVSNSSLSTYHSCPKKWYWNYVEGLKPRKVASALTLGLVIHEAQDRYFKSESIQSIRTWINKTYDDAISQAPWEDQEELFLGQKTALGMFLNFPYTQLTFQQIQSEREFKVQLDTDVMYIGRADGLVMLNNRWWVREIKTSGENISMFQKRAAVSSQATGTTWALEELDNIEIQGCLFEYCRKPKLIKKMSEDMYQFGERIYLDYCDARKRDTYFIRYTTYRSPVDIAIWKNDALKTAYRIQRSVKEDDFPRNTGSCYQFNKECPYFRICREENPSQMVKDLLYEKRERKIDAQETSQPTDEK